VNTILISDAAYIAQVSAIAFENYLRLRNRYRWMPEKKVEDIIPRIEWMTREGRVYGLEDGEFIRAFIGWFKLENFRNLGPGALTPDWCSGIAGKQTGQNVSRLISPLIRRLMTDLKDADIPIHAIGITAENDSMLEEISLLGYGRIVLDAAQTVGELLSDLSSQPAEKHTLLRGKSPIRIRPAKQADALALSVLDASLARHIGSPPVLMSDTSGDTVDEWVEWLADPATVTFVAESTKGSVGELVGFIKADPPHFDVSYFVHDQATLAIC